MRRYAAIIVDIRARKLDRPFTYRIPENLAEKITVGSLVRVPLRGRSVTGYVVDLMSKVDFPEEKIRDIEDVLRASSEDTGARAVQLAAWIAKTFGSTMSAALKCVVTTRGEAKPVETKEVLLAIPVEEAEEKLAFFEKKHQVARARLLSEMIRVPQQPQKLITDKLHVSSATIQALVRQGVLEVKTESNLRNPVSIKDAGRDELVLSREQQGVVDAIVRDFDHEQEDDTAPVPVSLIHGITGSGKTEVYIRIIEEIVKRGRQAIMLIPEISLTYQTLLRFYRHFGVRVSVMNSTLSESEKSDQFERARRGEIDVIIGPRSALFTPFPKPGVIVIDEEHESSYKNEQMPKYHARETAIELAKLTRASVVLGSATPSLDSYYRAKKGEYHLYTLTRRLTGGTLPEVSVVDMREELKAGNRKILSRALSKEIQDRLEKGEQTMLFLNRRGFSGFVSCRSCGSVLTCPHCDVALSYHRNGKMVCHYCGYEMPRPLTCPECGSSFLSGFRTGTEQVEEILKIEFPGARILRMDADTTAKKGAYEKLLSSFANEEADILLGTQMIVKGHDFPNVTLVGILLADLSLHVSDYRAPERTFQLLTQAAGRAGRGTRKGKVLIQTYEPENYAIRHAAKQDYTGFYDEEIGYRTQLWYPPVYEMLEIEIGSPSDDHAQLAAGRIRELLDKITKTLREHQMVIVIGPAAARISRVRDEYRYVVYVKSREYDTLIGCKDRTGAMMAAFQKAGYLTDVTLQYDFNPQNGW